MHATLKVTQFKLNYNKALFHQKRSKEDLCRFVILVGKVPSFDHVAIEEGFITVEFDSDATIDEVSAWQEFLNHLFAMIVIGSA